MKKAIISLFAFIAIIVNFSCKKSKTSDTTGTTVVTTFAGTGIAGYNDGSAKTAQFNSPTNIALDSKGNIFVVDQLNSRIREISPIGVVTTFAGSGVKGHLDGIGQAAQFYYPNGIAIDSHDNVYIADYELLTYSAIRKITPNGLVTTFAGGGLGLKDGNGTNSQFNGISAMCIDANDNLYISEQSNNDIRKISSTGTVSTVAGDSNGRSGFADGIGNSAKFNEPIGITIDKQNNLYVSDFGNYRVRKITQSGIVSTLAGDGTIADVNGPITIAEFQAPSQVLADAVGNVYVSEYGLTNNFIKKISPPGIVTIFAGNGVPALTNADLLTSSFNDPGALAIDASGSNMYVADIGNNCIRKIKLN